MSDAAEWVDGRERQATLDVGESSKRTANREPQVAGSVRFADDRPEPAPETEQSQLVAGVDERDSPGLGAFSCSLWDFDAYGPTMDRPVPEVELATIAGYDRRELVGTGLCPADLDPMGAWQWQSGPERFRRVATSEPRPRHPDDEHREDHYPDHEEARTVADLAETMSETKSETSDEPSTDSELRTDGGRDLDELEHELRDTARVLDHAVGLTWARGDVPQTKFAEMLRNLADAYDEAPEEAARPDTHPLAEYTHPGEPATDGGREGPTERVVVYTAPGLDGEVRRVTATNTTWNVDVARQFAAADCRARTGALPCEVGDIEILDYRDADADRDLAADGGAATTDAPEPEPDGSDELPGDYDPDAETVGDGWEGEYIYASWGYGQTNVDLAVIVDVSDSGKTVLARKTRGETVGQGATSNQLKPVAEPYGDKFRLHVRGGSRRDTPSFRGSYPLGPDGDMDDSTRLGSFGWFEDVSGESVHATAPGYGH